MQLGQLASRPLGSVWNLKKKPLVLIQNNVKSKKYQGDERALYEKICAQYDEPPAPVFGFQASGPKVCTFLFLVFADQLPLVKRFSQWSIFNPTFISFDDNCYILPWILLWATLPNVPLQ